MEFTKEHRFKLLEMYKILFPEYIDYKWDIIHCTDDIKYNGILFMYKKDGDNDEYHWFEFCWKILNKILSNNKIINPIYVKECILNFGMICFNNSKFQHPIDYLYEIFKQNEKI